MSPDLIMIITLPGPIALSLMNLQLLPVTKEFVVPNISTGSNSTLGFK